MITVEDLEKAHGNGWKIDYISNLLVTCAKGKVTSTLDIDGLLANAYNARVLTHEGGSFTISSDAIDRLGGVEEAILKFEARGWEKVQIGEKQVNPSPYGRGISNSTSYIVNLSN